MSLAAVIMLAIQFALGYASAWNKCVTFDEPSHLFAGYSYLKTGDYRLTPEHPPLVEMLCAAPLLAMNLNMPDLASPGAITAGAWDRGDPFLLGRAWLFTVGNDPDRIMRVARIPVLLISALGGWVLFRVARQVVRGCGALVVLAGWCFSPTVLAHARLVTTDLAAAVLFLAAAIAFWRLTRRVCVRTLLLAVVSFAALFTTKFSAVLILPIVVILAVVRLVCDSALVIYWRTTRRRVFDRRVRAVVIVACAVLIASSAVLTIWACFGFRFSGSADAREHYLRWGTDASNEPPEAEWEALTTSSDSTPTMIGRFTHWARSHRLLPEAYLYGLAYTVKSAEGRMAYLNGRVHSTGWWYYFPYAVLVKTTLPILLLGLGGALAWLAALTARRRCSALRRRRIIEVLLPCLVLSAVYLATSMTSGLNLGHRHVLPLYPTLFLLSAGWASCGATGGLRGAARASAVLLVALHVLIAARIHPHYLTYFNELVDGPRDAWRHLSGSNLDWGQDLIHLRRYLDDRRAAGIYEPPAKLSYFGTADPNYYLGNVDMLPSFVPFKPDVASASAPGLPPAPGTALTPGLYLISTTQLSGFYLRFGPGWSPGCEDMLQEAGEFLRQVTQAGDSEQRLDDVILAHRKFLAQRFPPEARAAFTENPCDIGSSGPT